jgi:hypothetical protein
MPVANAIGLVIHEQGRDMPAASLSLPGNACW